MAGHDHAALKRQAEREEAHKLHRMAGGGVHPDAKQDKILDDKEIKKAFSEHDKQLHGGKKTKLKLKDGGRVEGEHGRKRADKPSRHREKRDVGGAMPQQAGMQGGPPQGGGQGGQPPSGMQGRPMGQPPSGGQGGQPPQGMPQGGGQGGMPTQPVAQ